MRGRTYFANNLPVKELLRIVDGKKQRYPILHRIRFLWCKIVGHNMVTDRWVDDNGIDGEYFEGCRRCPLFRTYPFKEG